MKKTTQLSVIIFAACVGIGSANAEIITSAKDGDITGSFAGFSTKDTPCFVREPTMFGNGGASPLGPAFTEAGMNVTKDDSAPCEIDYRGFVSIHLNVDEDSKVVNRGVDWFYQYPEGQDKIPMAGPAILGDSAAAIEKLNAGANAKADTAKSISDNTKGEQIGSHLGAVLTSGIGWTLGGAVLGSLFDPSKPDKTAGIGHIKATITFKNGKDKPSHMEIEVNSASTTKERPVDLLRAVVKRLVVEIQAKEDALKKAEAEKAGTPATVATLTSETPKP